MHVVLIHIWSFSEQEAIFWNNVSILLKQNGNKLVLTGYSNVSIFEKHSIPYIYLRDGEIPGCIYNYDKKINSNLLSDEQIDEVIRFEGLWRSTSIEKERQLIKQNINYYSYLYFVLLQLLKPSIILVWNGYHPIELILRQIAHLQTIPTFFLERGPISGTLFFDKNGILSNSAFYKENNEITILKEPDSDKWIALTNQTINNYNQTNKTWWPQPQLSKQNWKQELNIKDKKVILFAEQINNDTQNFLFSPNFKKNIEALDWFCNQKIDFNKYFVIFKKHPMSKAKRENFELILQNKGAYIDEIPLNECFEFVDFVVAVNSTILHEALMKRKPALSLGNSILTDKNILYDIAEIANLQRVEQTINHWLNADDFDKKYLNYKRFLAIMLKKSLISTDAEQSLKYDIQKFINYIDEFKNRNQISSNLLIEYTSVFFKLIEEEIKNTTKKSLFGGNSRIQNLVIFFQNIYLRIKNPFA